MFQSAEDQNGVLDRELLARYVATRSHEAFGRIVDRHMPAVYSTCLRMLNDPHAAEDAAQATFMVLFRRADSSGPKACLAGWLCATARFCARNVQVSTQRRIRNEARAVCTLQHDFQRADPSPDQGEWDTIKPHLDDALAALPDPQRNAIVLRYFHNLSVTDAAREMNCPEPTLISRVQNGLRRLREKLRRKGAPVSAALLAGLLAERTVHAAPASLCASVKIIHAGAAAASPAAVGAASAALKTLAWGAVVPWLLSVGAALVSIVVAFQWFTPLSHATNTKNASASVASSTVTAPAPRATPGLPAPERFDDNTAWPMQGNLPAVRTADTITVSLVADSSTYPPAERISDFCRVLHSKKWNLADGPVSCRTRVTIPSAPTTAFEIGVILKFKDTVEPVLRKFGLTYDGGQVLVQLNSEMAKFVPGRIVTYDYRDQKAVPLLGDAPKLNSGSHDLEFTISGSDIVTRVDGNIIYQKPHGLQIEGVQFDFLAAVKKGNTTSANITIDHPSIDQYKPGKPEPKEF